MYFLSRISAAAILLCVASQAWCIDVVASADDGNVASNTLDGNLSTRWSAQGNGQWIRYDLGRREMVDDIDIAFYRGDQRTATIQIQVSDTTSNWQTLFNGSSQQRSGFQNFQLTDSAARYVRIVGFGNSQNSWNSLTEVRINTNGPVDPPPPPPPPGNNELWVENFSLANGTSEDNGSTAWTTETSGIKSNGSLDVRNGALDGNNTGAEVRWVSESIDISGADAVVITAAVEGLGRLDGPDYIEMGYRLNGGAIQRFGRRNDDLSLTTVQSGELQGSTLQLFAFFKNSASDEHYLLREVVVDAVSGTNPPPPPPPPDGGLDPSLPPSGNFDLGNWKITLPDASENDVAWMINGGEVANVFYTDPQTGGMVFQCPNRGGSTSGSSFSRTELREMLRGTNTSIRTKGINKNNWVISTANASNRNAAGGVDGVMVATLRVDRVSTTGESSKVGRVIVGQIHGEDDEPIRLYYRKLPGNSKGSIYFASERWQGSDRYFELIGSRSSSASNPTDGIALGERWSYEIEMRGRDLTVTIFRENGQTVTETVQIDSEYSGDWMYFKAGAYNQNNTGDADDFVKVTFFDLRVSHD